MLTGGFLIGLLHCASSRGVTSLFKKDSIHRGDERQRATIGSGSLSSELYLIVFFFFNKCIIVNGVTRTSGFDVYWGLIWCGVWLPGHRKYVDAWNVGRKCCCDFSGGFVNRQRRCAWAFYTWWSRAEEFQNQRLLQRIVRTLQMQLQSPAHCCT